MLNKTNLLLLWLLLPTHGAEGLICYNCTGETSSCYKPTKKDAKATCVEATGKKPQCFLMDYKVESQTGVLRGCVPHDMDYMCGDENESHQNRLRPQLIESCILCSTDLCNSAPAISITPISNSPRTNVLHVYFCISFYSFLKVF